MEVNFDVGGEVVYWPSPDFFWDGFSEDRWIDRGINERLRWKRERVKDERERVRDIEIEIST